MPASSAARITVTARWSSRSRAVESRMQPSPIMVYKLAIVFHFSDVASRLLTARLRVRGPPQRSTHMRWIVGSLVFASLLSTPQDDGMVRVRSTRDFNQTVAALDSAIIERNLKIFARVDHAANARGVSMELRPTTVFIFGNPQVGSRLMQCEQTAAIDLPLKMLVWQDSTSAIWVGYEAPARLSERHKVKGCQDVIDRFSTALAGLAAVATGTARR